MRNGQCSSTAIVALTAAAFHVSQEINRAVEKSEALLALNAQVHLERLISPAKELAMYWPNAEAVLKLFHGFNERFRMSSIEWLGDQGDRHYQNSSKSRQEFNREESEREMETGLDTSASGWQDILLYLKTQQSLYVSEEGWMNVSPEPGTGMGV